MADRKRKLAELERFRRAVPHVSASALSATIREAKARGLPELDSRHAIAEARQNALEEELEAGNILEEVPVRRAVGQRE